MTILMNDATSHITFSCMILVTFTCRNVEQRLMLFSNPEMVHLLILFAYVPIQELRNRGADVTRNSVQKSVCVLSRLVSMLHILCI